MNFLKKALISFFTAPIVAAVGSLVLEARYHTFITLNQLLLFFGAFALAAIVVGKAAKLPISILMAVAVGVLMAPYFQFFLGQINIFVTDPPQFRESVSVPEIRVQLGDLKLTNERGEEVVVLKETPVHKLYPGKNIVNLGALDIPAGNYKGGKMSVKDVEVDVEIDIEKEVELSFEKMAAQFRSELASLPPEAQGQVDAAEIESGIRAAIRDGIVRWFLEGSFREFIPEELSYSEETESILIRNESGVEAEYEKLSREVPITMDIKDMREDGGKIKFTFQISVGEQELPMQFPYPAGRGGPDIILDIMLNELGFPVNIQPIVKLPPGMPEFRVPATVPTMPANIMPPSDLEIPAEYLQLMNERIEAGRRQAEEARAAAEAAAGAGR